jgi:hypothetical protein
MSIVSQNNILRFETQKNQRLILNKIKQKKKEISLNKDNISQIFEFS